ncbi:MAG: dihydrofolate reductase family protein [Blastocatellia bacterium]|nr:dihydrofolate reductase family protein [Blastocatellia bacterium]
MGIVSLYIATSLDGYIAGPNHEIDWLFTDQDYGFAEFYASVDAIVMGRKTYEVSLSFGEYPHSDKPNYVATRSATFCARHAECARTLDEPFINQLRSAYANKIWLLGGGELVRLFQQRDWIDEYVIAIHPILLGTGLPLFPGTGPTHHLEHKATKTFSSGLVQIFYSRQQNQAA